MSSACGGTAEELDAVLHQLQPTTIMEIFIVFAAVGFIAAVVSIIFSFVLQTQ